MEQSQIQIEYVRTGQAYKILQIGKTKFYNLVAQGYITVIKPEGPDSRMGYVSMAQLRKFQSGELAK
ncbi:hypothetical protein [Spirosoma flavum]|uniref:Helix-turn-helix domain-containing protein n=1 Tax=Spirosoma flavum TaxID=2048557 RepID=A0ABW6ANZ3_9BACT